MSKIVVDPITRIEGHLKIEVTTENGVVKDAQSSGMMFRGLELILRGRDPRDAQRYTQRICGVCPTSHSIASTLNLDSAFGLAGKIPDNGRTVRNLILGAAHIADHILHFYHLTALDYVDVTKILGYDGNDPALNSVKEFAKRGELAPFVPRYEGDYRLSDKQNIAALAHYVQALEMRRKGQEMLTIFGGKMPHNMAVIPGGVTCNVTVDKIAAFLWRLNELRDFIDNVYIPDVLMVAETYSDYFGIGAGCGNLLSYGQWDLDGTNPDYTKRNRLVKQGTVSTDLKPGELDPGKIMEYVKHSWYADSSTGKHPTKGVTEPQYGKAGAYSWVKAPRYDGKVYEVGPLAGMAVSYVKGEPTVKALVDSVLGKFKASPSALFSVLGRHAARALITKFVADSMPGWLLQLKPGEPAYIDYEIPDEGMGMGLVDGARGALGHWVEIKDKKIDNYQCVVPSTWNLCPRDDKGQPGPVEQALIGTKIKDEKNPFEIGRIVRSFDPCLACAIHLITPKGKTLGVYRVC
ncbi:MAG: nickel-dependent hydrogenase large subunit [Chloroflexi bacterium]|nr:nickel-dependent hydrogenase large subunit [Chloroflexota bacterium]MBM3173073.1 nickel-dependent hydrogenase large subunit [Chloroflexota bacterium]MBM3174696.1 nickel-dependent hydrogenase large subunit [Chloroflexota bacterium]MBM4450608.1 nickel-dependent hydrogenase large subunit [Chloroflexota bacterium]